MFNFRYLFAFDKIVGLALAVLFLLFDLVSFAVGLFRRVYLLFRRFLVLVREFILFLVGRRKRYWVVEFRVLDGFKPLLWRRVLLVRRGRLFYDDLLGVENYGLVLGYANSGGFDFNKDGDDVKSVLELLRARFSVQILNVVEVSGFKRFGNPLVIFDSDSELRVGLVLDGNLLERDLVNELVEAAEEYWRNCDSDNVEAISDIYISVFVEDFDKLV